MERRRCSRPWRAAPRGEVDAAVGGQLEPLVAAARLAVTLRRTRTAHLDRLREGIDPALPMLYVPYLFARTHGLRSTRVVAEALAGELGY